MAGERAAVDGWLRGLPATLELPSTLPLYALLRAADVHVTYSSSTVVEAEAFGIGSVLLGRYGAEFMVSNDERLQRKWAAENGCPPPDGPGWEQEIILEQVRKLRPYAVWMAHQ